MIRLYSIGPEYTKLMFMFPKALALVMLTCYRGKFLAAKDSFHSVLKNIGFMDKCLASVDIKVPHKLERTVCAVYGLSVTSVNVLYFMDALMPDSSADISEALEAAMTITLFFTLMAFTTTFIFIAWILRQRGQLVNRGVGRLVITNGTRPAWSSTRRLVLRDYK